MSVLSAFQTPTPGMYVGLASNFYVGWGTLALINAGLGQSKNRSGLNWFLLSLILGPVATFILVALYEPARRKA